jgi:cysteine sulfinate desulfinase/cysteine desulfurase-like protein
MGVTDSVGSAAVRFSLGRTTTQDEIDETVQRIVTTITRTRVPSITP